MIAIKHEKVNFGDLDIDDIYQVPTIAISNYWKGTAEELYQYYEKHNVDTNFGVNNLNQLHQRVEDYLIQLKSAIDKDIGKFDFRLRSSLKPRNLNVSDNDYMKITFDIKDENKEEIINAFVNAKSRSFVDFRQFGDDKVSIIYNRKGMCDEGNRIAIVKSKPSVTLRDEFKEAKDNNYVMSGLIKELSNIDNLEFSFKYMVGNAEKEMKVNSNEINKIADRVEEKNKKSVEEVKIKEEAKQEIKKENMQTRQSLSPDSNTKIINKEGTSDIRIDTKKIDTKDEANISSTKEQLDKLTKNSIDNYELKEIEKIKLRLAKARDEASIVYTDMKNKINNDGMSISEALNYVKGKYREEHTINLASVFLTKDILEVGTLEQMITNKDIKIQEQAKDVKNKDDEITKREHTISSLKSTLQSKQNELSLEIENHTKDIEILEKKSEKTIDELKEAFKNKLNENENSLKEADELIIRLSEQKTLYEKELVTQTNIIKSKDSELVKLKTAINLKDDELAKTLLEAKLQEKNYEEVKKINVVDKSLIEELKQKISVLENTLAKKDDVIASKDDELAKTLAAKDDVIASKDSAISKIETELQSKDERIKDLESKILEIENHKESDKINKIDEKSEKILNFLKKLDIITENNGGNGNVDKKSRVSDILNRGKQR